MSILDLCLKSGRSKTLVSTVIVKYALDTVGCGIVVGLGLKGLWGDCVILSPVCVSFGEASLSDETELLHPVSPFRRMPKLMNKMNFFMGDLIERLA